MRRESSLTGSWPRALAIGSAVAAAALAAWFLPLGRWTTSLADYARDTGPAGVAVFFVAYVVSTVALLPGSILTLAAGFVYGPVWGLALASPASVTGATCAFLLGRTVLSGWARRQVERSSRVRVIDAAVEREGFKLVLLLRLSPLVPFNLLNYALSLTRVTLGRYVLASALGMLPGTVLNVYLGSLAPAAAELLSATRGGSSTRTALSGLGLLATVAVAMIAARAVRRALHTELDGELS